ncbi:MAG: hypothetical protein ACK47B_17670 [Armatimonadota bacterium]
MPDAPLPLESPFRTEPPRYPPAPPGTGDWGGDAGRPQSWSQQVRICLQLGREALEQARRELQARELGADSAGDCASILKVERQVVTLCATAAHTYVVNAPPESVRPDPNRSEPGGDEVFLARFRGHLLCLLGMGVEPEVLDRALGTDVFRRRGEAERAPGQPVIPRYSLPTGPWLTLEEGLTLPGLVFAAAAFRALQREAERDESYSDLETLERGLYRRYLATLWAALLAE